MRKLVYSINITLDGCCDHTQFTPDDEMMDYFTRLIRGGDTFVYGRTTYELMVPYWPDVAKDPAGQSTADHAFAQAFDAVDKFVVFSKTLGETGSGSGDGKTRIVRTGLREEILKLKQEPGKDIMTGGVDLATQLAKLGLIDEYYFVVHPIVGGKGRRVFEGVDLKLKLIGSTELRSGVVALRYIKNQPL